MVSIKKHTHKLFNADRFRIVLSTSSRIKYMIPCVILPTGISFGSLVFLTECQFLDVSEP